MLTLESAETPREFTLQPLLRGDCGGVRFSPRRGFFFGVSRVAIRESDCLFESGNVSRASARRSINVFFGAYRGDAGFTRRRTSFAHLVAFRACVSSGGNCCPRADCNLTRGCFKYLQRRGASWVRDHKHTRGYGSVRAESARATRTSQPDRHAMIDDSFAMLLALSMAAQSPHEAAALVSLPTIHTYLTARGWTPGKIPPWTFGRGIVWDAPPSTHGDDYGVLFPNTEETRDYAMVLVDAANGVGVEESRKGTNVLAAWLFAQWQTGTFRVTP